MKTTTLGEWKNNYRIRFNIVLIFQVFWKHIIDDQINDGELLHDINRRYNNKHLREREHVFFGHQNRFVSTVVTFKTADTLPDALPFLGEDGRSRSARRRAVLDEKKHHVRGETFEFIIVVDTPLPATRSRYPHTHRTATRCSKMWSSNRNAIVIIATRINVIAVGFAGEGNR